MLRLLTIFGEWLLNGSLKKILLGAGLGLGSAAVSLTAIQTYINRVVSVSSGFSSDMLALCALSGADIALSSILGAIVYKLTVGAAKLSLVRR